MRYTLLGNSGLRVSEVALGTMTFGTDWGWGASASESVKQFELFAEAGGTLIDTANNYTNGTAESILGELLATDRDHFVVGTKYSLNIRDGDLNANPDTPAAGRRLADVDPGRLAIARAVADIAGGLGLSSSVVALAWLRAQLSVIPILGARTVQQLADNLTCLDVNLPPGQSAHGRAQPANPDLDNEEAGTPWADIPARMTVRYALQISESTVKIVHIGGSRATAVTSDRHAARLVFQRVSEPSSESLCLAFGTAAGRVGARMSVFWRCQPGTINPA